MSVVTRHIVFFCSTLLWLSAVSLPVQANTDAAQFWLSQQQQFDGRVYHQGDTALPFQITAEAQIVLMETPHSLNEPSLRQYLLKNTWSYYTTEELSLLYFSRLLGEEDIAAVKSELLVRQNFDGGIGALPGYSSTPIDTAWALQVLGALNERTPAVIGALNFLQQQQTSDGAWPLSHTSVNSYLAAVAQVAQSVWWYRHQMESANDMLHSAANYLQQYQPTALTTLEISQVLIALAPVSNKDITKSYAIELMSRQSDNGSWNSDTYQTAKALQALKATELGDVDTIRISGRLIDGDSQKPLPNITVSLLGSGSDAVVSSVDGSFAFSVQQAGDYKIDINVDGFNAITWAATLELGDNQQLGDIVLLPDNGVISATILGTVSVAEDNAPLANVIVRLASDPANTVEQGIGREVKTDDDGNYILTNASAGDYQIEFHKAGYVSSFYRITLQKSQRAILSPQLKKRQQISPSISGVITTDGGDISGAVVTLSGSYSNTTVLDSTGEFSFSDLPTGNSQLKITHVGYQTLTSEFTFESGAQYSVHQTLIQQDEPPKELTSSVRGRVITADTKVPVSRSIALNYANIDLKTTSDEDGYFEFNNISSNAIYLRVEGNDYQNLVVRAATPYGATTHLGDLELLPENLAPIYAYEGTVVDSQTNSPLANATIVLADAENTYQVTSDTQGHFEFDAIQSPEPILSVSIENYVNTEYIVAGTDFEKTDLGQIRLRPEGINSYLPDLIVSKVNTKAIDYDQRSLSIAGPLIVSVKNQSRVPVSHHLQLISFYDVNTNNEYDSGIDISLGESQLAPMGGNSKQDISISIEANLPYYNAPISVMVDSKNQLIEADEKNNIGRNSCRKSCEFFNDDFNLERSISWLDMGISGAESLTWKVNNGILEAPLQESLSVLANNVKIESDIFNDAWKDYSASTDIYLPNDNAAQAGIVVRYVDSRNWMLITLTHQKIILSKMVNGVYEHEIESVNKVHAVGEWHSVRVQVARNFLKVFSGENLVLEFDEIPFVYGKTGLYASGHHIKFDNYRVDNCNGILDIKEKWHWGSPSKLSKYMQVMTTPMVAQTNDDNNDGLIDVNDYPDVIFTAFDDRYYTNPGVMYALSGKTGEVLWQTSEAQPSAYYSNAIADIDNDGLIEIIAPGGFSRGKQYLIIYENDGSLKSRVRVSQYGSPAISDLDGDGKPEIIMSDRVYDANGVILYSGEQHDPYSLVVDIDFDGKQDLFAAGIVYNTRQGFKVWEKPNTIEHSAVGNFDNDEFPEIAAIVNRQSLIVFDQNGDTLWGPVVIPGGGGGPITVADMDGDGEPEMGVAGKNYYVVFEADGSVKWTSRTKDFSSSITGSSVFDFDGDGRAEILYNDEELFRIYDGETGEILYSLENPSGTLWEYPVVVDIDNDNHAEIVLASNNYAFPGNTGITVLEGTNDDWMPTRSIWNQHSYHITNINDDGTVPQHEQPSWLTHNTYRLNTFIDRNVHDRYDLTLGKLTLTDHGVGQPMSLSARIGNAGTLASNVSVVEFYKNNLDAENKLGEIALAALAINEYTDVHLHGVVNVSNGDTLIAVVNRQHTDDECEADNNQQRIPASAIIGSIGLQVSQSSYLNDDTAAITATITNTGLFTNSYQVRWQLLDSNGLKVAELLPQVITDLVSGEASTLPILYPLHALQSGTYQVSAQLQGVDASGNTITLDNALVTFKVLATDSQGDTAQVILSLNTDKPVYQGFDQVQLASRARNLAVNTQLPAARALLVITSPSGDVVFNHSFSPQALAANSLRDMLTAMTLSDATAGEYQASIELLDNQTNALIAQAHTSFTVVTDSLQSITGTTTATPSTVAASESVMCEHSAHYTGGEAAEFELHYTVLSANDNRVLNTHTTLHTFNSDARYRYSQSVNTNGFSVGSYLCVQQASRTPLDVNNTAISPNVTLSFANFDITEASTEVTATAQSSHRVRLLVLVDTLHAELSPEVLQQEQQQQQVLQQTLNDAGWLYTLVDNAGDFTQAMQTGGYSMFALLAERVSLPVAVQQQLNARVHEGDGLLVAQGNNFLYPELQVSMGAQVNDYDLHIQQAHIQPASVLAPLQQVSFASMTPTLNIKPTSSGAENKAAKIIATASELNSCGITPCASLTQRPLGVAGEYNALVFEHFTAPSSTVEGRLAVGGDLSVSGYSIGDKLDSTTLTDTLVVSGDVTYPVGRIYYGNALVGGSVSGIGSNVFAGMAPGTSIQGNLHQQPDRSLPINFAATQRYLTSLSEQLGQLPANGEVKVEWGGYYLTGDGVSDVQLFHVDAEVLAAVHSFVVSGIPDDATVIFNIHGGDQGSPVDVSNISFEDLKNHSFTTLYNFPQATAIHFNGVKMRGSVLAPKANIHNPNGDIFGQLLAARWNGVMSISLYGFAGDLSAVVEPMQLHNVASLNHYGQGKVIFTGFDLAHAMARDMTATPGDSINHWLLQSLEAITPTLPVAAGRYRALDIRIDNLKSDAQGYLDIELPQATTLLLADLSQSGHNRWEQITDTHWRYHFGLEAQSSSTTTVYVTVPNNPASIGALLYTQQNNSHQLQHTYQWPLFTMP